MARRKTNVQALTDMMEVSNYGALAQVFILEAISRYADDVAEADPSAMSNPMISGRAWVGVAKEIKGKMAAHLSR